MLKFFKSKSGGKSSAATPSPKQSKATRAITSLLSPSKTNEAQALTPSSLLSPPSSKFKALIDSGSPSKRKRTDEDNKNENADDRGSLKRNKSDEQCISTDLEVPVSLPPVPIELSPKQQLRAHLRAAQRSPILESGKTCMPLTCQGVTYHVFRVDPSRNECSSEAG